MCCDWGGESSWSHFYVLCVRILLVVLSVGGTFISFLSPLFFFLRESSKADFLPQWEIYLHSRWYEILKDHRISYGFYIYSSITAVLIEMYEGCLDKRSNFISLRVVPFKAQCLLHALQCSTLESSSYFPKSVVVCFVWVSEKQRLFFYCLF